MSYREHRDDHRLEIEHVLLEGGVIAELDINVICPPECERAWNQMPACAITHEANAIGLGEALGLSTTKLWRGHGKTVLTEQFTELAYSLLGLALMTSRVNFVLTYSYSSWIDLSGEGEVEMEWWLR